MDIQYLLFLQNIRESIGGVFDNFFSFITMIAVDYYIVIPALILFWAVDKRKGSQVIMTIGTALGINAALKATFCVYRPWIRNSEVHPLESALPGATGYSFPSGHSTSASSFYFGIANAYRKYKGIVIFCTIMVLLTMFSRNYVGVHTPQDVLVGGSIGLICSFLIAKALSMVDNKPEKDYLVLILATIYAVLVLLYIYFKDYPIDYVNGTILVDPKKMTIDGFKDPGVFYGTILGWFIERRFIKFDISGTKYQKVMRCIFGGLLYVFTYTSINQPIGKAINFGPVYFALQAIQVAFFMTVYPIIFKAIENKKNNN